MVNDAHSTFMRLMNHMLRSFIGKFVVVYFDDILIYRKWLDEHITNLRQVLEILRKERLDVNLKNYNICIKQIMFWGYVVSAKGIEINDAKIKDIQE
jgi:hypothetical protein